MKPESRISGAVGILIAGFFTAMILRPETEAEQQTASTLRNSQAVQTHLSQRKARPYLPQAGTQESQRDRTRQMEELLKLTAASQVPPTQQIAPAQPLSPALEKEILGIENQPATSNPPSVAPNNTPAVTEHTPVLTDADEREHTVEHGDTLSGISLKYYGSIRHVDFLFNANRTQLRSPNALQIGMTLTIPPLKAATPEQPAELGMVPPPVQSSQSAQQQSVKQKAVPQKDVHSEPALPEATPAEPRRLSFPDSVPKHSLMSSEQRKSSLFVPFRRIAEEQRLRNQ